MDHWPSRFSSRLRKRQKDAENEFEFELTVFKCFLSLADRVWKGVHQMAQADLERGRKTSLKVITWRRISVLHTDPGTDILILPNTLLTPGQGITRRLGRDDMRWLSTTSGWPSSLTWIRLLIKGILKWIIRFRLKRMGILFYSYLVPFIRNECGHKLFLFLFLFL